MPYKRVCHVPYKNQVLDRVRHFTEKKIQKEGEKPKGEKREKKKQKNEKKKQKGEKNKENNMCELKRTRLKDTTIFV